MPLRRPKRSVRSTRAAAAIAAVEAEEAALLGEIQAGRADVAEARCRALAQATPKASLPHRILGFLAAQRGAVDDAIAHFQAATAGRPARREAHVNLARLLLGRGRFEAALDALQALADAFPAERDGVEALIDAQARLGAGDAEGGLAAALEALERAPGNENALRVVAATAGAVAAPAPTPQLLRALTLLASQPEEVAAGDFKIASAALARALAALGDPPPARLDALSVEAQALAIALLSHRMVADPTLERFLTAVRRGLLADLGAADRPAPPVAALEAFARHGFLIEHLWAETAAETALVDALEARATAALGAGGAAPLAALYAIGAYRPLVRIAAVRDWVAAAPEAVPPTLRQLVAEPIAEQAIARDLPRLTPIEDAVSQAVQAQYEENPYPRWRNAPERQAAPYVAQIREAIAPNAAAFGPGVPAPRVLVAGGGTGRHPISVAQRYQGAQVVAIDLSRASLAYGARQAAALGVGNVRFAQADILKLPEIAEQFDVVEASGVIHHMRDPEAGLRALLSVLKPDGFLKLGLYSRRARSDVSRARAFVAAQGYASDLAGLRAFRRDYLAGARDGIGDLTHSRDFYLASNLRDLVFHVQEHQFDPLEIGAMLARNGLAFLGFSHLDRAARAAYAAETPQDPTQTDLTAWDAFEARHPRFFAAMYQFWCRRR